MGKAFKSTQTGVIFNDMLFLKVEDLRKKTYQFSH